tara:strand:+ start:1348 stop:1800 length:453 start_codon:yes stop_codon:yes gene_type:complete
MSKITLLQEYDSPVLLETASEGWIYRISNKYVVKVNACKRYKKDMFHEILITRLLYSFGISVPEPITCDYVKVDNEVKMGYIMEFIDGKAFDDETISDKDLILAKKLLDKEVKLSLKLGFSFPDDCPQWIFTKDKKIKIIDFTKWNYKGL